MSRAPLLCVGDPLLDIQVREAEDLIAKYGLRANDALRATPELLPLYDEISRREPVATLVAGGAAQNTARAAAYILPPNSVVYTGCVGADARADFLSEANEREGVRSAYNVHPTLPTGACAVLLTGQDRSLVTNLGAAGAYDVEHFRTPEMVDILAGAKIIYTTGFFLANSLECVLLLARHAAEHNQTFVLNISAPFIPRLHFSKFAAVFPFCDIVLGNDADARSWAIVAGLQPADAAAGSSSYLPLASIADTIASLPFDASKSSAAKRTVILTNGPEPTVLTQSPGNFGTRAIVVPKVAADEVVDTNGAGDAFAGGLFAGLVIGKELEESVALGHRMGAMSVRHVGPQYTFPKVDVLSDL